MGYQRRVLHYGLDGVELLGPLSGEAVAGCWFELHRQGGCGAGELRLRREFLSRDGIEPGHWVGLEFEPGVRWYLGRVEEVSCESPGGMRLQLEGPSVELNEVFPGSLVATAAGVKPHRYSRLDRFSDDPDRDQESVDVVINSKQLIEKLLAQYVVPTTGIGYVPELVEAGPLADDVTSVKFRGEETVRSVIKDLAVRARNASWGVDAERRFFFLQSRAAVLGSFQENRDLVRLHEVRARDLLYNRLMLTGDYVYDRKESSGQIARRSYRWRGNYRHSGSVDQYGERRIRLWVPWIRTAEDSESFAREFLRVYGVPARRFLVETGSQSVLPWPWLGTVELRDRTGTVLAAMQPETVRVEFDHSPRLRMELGPVDPHELWEEPAYDERWELPEGMASGYGGADFPSLLMTSGGGPVGSEPGDSGGGPGGSSASGVTSLGSADSDSSEVSDESEMSEDSAESGSSAESWVSSEVGSSSAMASSGDGSGGPGSGGSGGGGSGSGSAGGTSGVSTDSSSWIGSSSSGGGSSEGSESQEWSSSGDGDPSGMWSEESF